MLEAVIAPLLNTLLGSFVEGLDRQNLQLKLWSGKVHLSDLSLKPTALAPLSLPLELVCGRVHHLQMEAQWRALHSQPVSIHLQGVQVLARMKQAALGKHQEEMDEEKRKQEEREEREEAQQRILASKSASLAAVEEFRLSTEKEAAETKSSTGKYVSRLLANIIDNVQVSVKDVLIRVQFEDVQRSCCVELGIGLEELSAFTTDSSGKPAFVSDAPQSFRQVQLKNLFLYMRELSLSETTSQLHVSDLLCNSSSVRFIVAPVNASLSMVHHKVGPNSPRVEVQMSVKSIVLTLSQPHIRDAYTLLSLIGKNDSYRQASLADTSKTRELSQSERERYKQCYKRSLNALWLPDLTPDEHAFMQQLERDCEFGVVNKVRTHAFFELKRELHGRAVMRRADAYELEQNKGGMLRNFFRSSTSAKTIAPPPAPVSINEQSSHEQDEDVDIADDAPLPSVTIALRLLLPRIALLLEETSERPLMSLDIEHVSIDFTKTADTQLTLVVGLQSIRAIDRSEQGQTAIAIRREIISVAAVSTDEHELPFEIKFEQLKNMQTLRCKTDVQVKLIRFKFSMAAVLIRIGVFFSQLPSISTKYESVSNSSDADADTTNEASLTEQVLSNEAVDEAVETFVSDVTHVVVQMNTISLQLVANPRQVVSAAMLISLSGILTVDLEHDRDDSDQMAIKGTLNSIQCYVADLDANDEEKSTTMQCNSRILQPFSVSLLILQTTPHLFNKKSSDGCFYARALEKIQDVIPSRTSMLSIDPIILRLSYSSYRLLTDTVQALIEDADLESATQGFEFTTIPTKAEQEDFSVSRVKPHIPLLQLFADDNIIFDVQSIRVSLINDCLKHDVPFIKLDIEHITGDLHGYAHSRQVRLFMNVSVQMFDFERVIWQPILEPFSCTAVLSSSVCLNSRKQNLLHPNSENVTSISTAAGGRAYVEGSVSQWLSLRTSSALNVNISISMLSGVIDALNLLNKVEQHHYQNRQTKGQQTSITVAPDNSLSAQKESNQNEFMPYRIENSTEFDVVCKGRYYLRAVDANGFPSTPAHSTSGAQKEFGPWNVFSYDSSGFAFPEQSSYTEQLLVMDIEQPYHWPPLVIPFSHVGVQLHRLPLSESDSRFITLVSEIFIEDGIKVCRLRSRVGLKNQTETEFEWQRAKHSGTNRRLPAFSTVFLPLMWAEAFGTSLQVRPGFENSSFAFSPALSIRTQDLSRPIRFTCARALEVQPPTLPHVNNLLDFAADLSGVFVCTSFSSAGRRVESHDTSDCNFPRSLREQHKQDDRLSPHAFIFSLRPAAKLENLCPLELQSRVLLTYSKSETVLHQVTVNPGHSVSLFSALQTSPSSLSFLFPGLLQPHWTSSSPLLGDPHEKDRVGHTLRTIVKDERGHEIVINLEYALRQGCSVLSIYVPYWIFDRTGLNVIMSTDRKRTVPLGLFQTLEENKQADAINAVMFNFPVNPARSSDARLGYLSTYEQVVSGSVIKSAVWSEPFNLDAVGLSFSLSLTLSRTINSGLIPTADVGVSIEAGQGRWRRTKIINLTPGLIIVNELNAELALAQCEHENLSIHLAANAQMAWTWPDKEQEKEKKKEKSMLMKRVGVAYEEWRWSGLFHPTRIGSTNMAVRHAKDPSRLWYVRVESRLQGATIFCVISAYPQEPSVLASVLPYRIVNRLIFHTIRFRQQLEGVSYGPWIEVAPQTSLPYAWEEPLLSGEIEWQAGVKYSALGERWDNADIVAMNTPKVFKPKPLKPLPGDQTQDSHLLFTELTAAGPNRILTFSMFPSLLELESSIIKEQLEIKEAKRRRKRWEINVMLQAQRRKELEQCLRYLDVNLSQLAARRRKSEVVLQRLEAGDIQRLTSLKPNESALQLVVHSVRNIPPSWAGGHIILVTFLNHKDQVGPVKSDAAGFCNFGAKTLTFRTNQQPVASTCRLSLIKQDSQEELGFVGFSLFEFDDHRPRDLWLPLTVTKRSILPLPEINLTVWWIPSAAPVVRASQNDILAAQMDWERVRTAVCQELDACINGGQVQGIVVSANTEVQYMVEITGIRGIEAGINALPARGGRIFVRLTSELTDNVSTSLLFQDNNNIRNAIVSSKTKNSSEVEKGQAVSFYVPEDALDLRQGDTLHFEFFFQATPSSITTSATDRRWTFPQPVLLAHASLPLNDVPVSRPESFKVTDEEARWTSRPIPIQSLLRTGKSIHKLSMEVTIRQYVARSDEQRALSKLSLMVDTLSLSFLTHTSEELLLLTIKGVNLTLEEARTSQTAILRIVHAQLDNQLPTAVFPVILSPSYVPVGARQPLLQVSLMKDRGVSDATAKASYDISSFEYFTVLLQTLDIRVEETLIYNIIALVNQLETLDFNTSQQVTRTTLAEQQSEHPNNQASQNDPCYVDVIRFKHSLKLNKGREEMLYFHLLHIQPLQFYVSFLAKPGMRAHMAEIVYNPFQLVLSAAGSTLGSIENAPIRLPALMFENVMNSTPVLITTLVESYRSHIISQAYKMIGALDFLGNPRELLSSLGTGVSDFFYEPAAGLVKSPLDFGRGVAAGTSSLFKNTVSGFFGAASKITNSMGQAAAFLSLDDEFIAEQQARKVRSPPVNAVTGITGGMQSLGESLFAGVTGVFTDPVKGAQKEGLGGFLKGVGKGVAGVIAKPTSGLIGAVSSTMQGIGNSASDVENTRARRIRPQRLFDKETGQLLKLDNKLS